MSERIGIVTGGGDCPGLNAVIRAVAKAAAKRGWETIGYQGSQVGAAPITEAIGRLKTVPPTGGLARTARALGICLGDEEKS